MKIDWNELEKGFEKEAFLRDAYKGVKDWAVGGLESAARGTADTAEKVWSALPGVQQLQDMGRFSNYMGGGGLMKDLGGVAAVGLPLMMAMGGRKKSGTPNIHIDLGASKNILGAAPGEVRSLSSPKMAELLKSAGLGSALLKGLGAVKNVAKPAMNAGALNAGKAITPAADALTSVKNVAKPAVNTGALNAGKAVAPAAPQISAVKNVATPPMNPNALNMGSPALGHSFQNAAHLDRIDLRQAIQNARVYGRTPANISPIQSILNRRNLRMQQMQGAQPIPGAQPMPGIGTKAANLIDPSTLRTVVLSRMTNDVISGIEKNKAKQPSPRMLELVSKYPEMQQMLANPDTRAYFEKLLTKESQQHTDEKNIYPSS